MKKTLVAAAFVCAFASSSYADLIFLGGTPTYNSTTFGSSGDINSAGPPDGIYTTFTDVTGTGAPAGSTVTLNPQAGNWVGHDGEVAVIIYTGHANTTATINLTQIFFQDTSGRQAFYNPNQTLVFMPTSNTTDIYVKNFITGSNLYSSYTLSSPDFSFRDIDRISLTYTTVGANTSGTFFQVDAVSNPEPGTLALFGLGALGLGGFAWKKKRRTARVVA